MCEIDFRKYMISHPDIVRSQSLNRTQIRIFNVIKSNPGLTATEISKKIHLTRDGVMAAVKKMKAAGYIDTVRIYTAKRSRPLESYRACL